MTSETPSDLPAHVEPTPEAAAVAPDEVSAAPAEHTESLATEPAPEPIDLAASEADLDDVQQALTRLADGSYWTDEVTGDVIADHVLHERPLTRRA